MSLVKVKIETTLLVDTKKWIEKRDYHGFDSRTESDIAKDVRYLFDIEDELSIRKWADGVITVVK